MTAPRSRFVQLPGRRLHLLEWGDAAAPVLVLVHGLRDHARSWDWVAAPLSQRFHVIAVDLRGHGDSDWAASYNLHDYVRDLAAIITALDLSDIHLVGHSLGGHIVLRYAATYPEKLACLGVIEGIELPLTREHRKSPRPYPHYLREWIEQSDLRESNPHRTYPSHEAALARMVQEHPTIALDTLDHLVRHGIVAEGKGWRWKYDNACRYRAPDDARGLDLEEVLDAIACPTMLAYGGASWVPLPPPERLARIARHRVVHFPGVSHWIHHESRADFISALGGFLADPEGFVKDAPVS